MTLKDLLRKKSHIQTSTSAPELSSAQQDSKLDFEVPEFTFMRTTTTTQEIISPPSFPGDYQSQEDPFAPSKKDALPVYQEKKRRSMFSRSSSKQSMAESSAASDDNEGGKIEQASRPRTERKLSTRLRLGSSSGGSAGGDAEGPKNELAVRPRPERKLSERLRLGSRSRTTSRESISMHLPEGLGEAPETVAVPLSPAAPKKTGGVDMAERKEVKEASEEQWEKRATRLALGNPLLDGDSIGGQHKSSNSASAHFQENSHLGQGNTSRSSAEQEADDSTLQEAIRLHEAGDLAASTALFGTLANPHGANSALSQVLYGLALRHGWGIAPSAQDAVHYLSLAASNSASIESAALAAGLRQGGAAKGELVLAIFELANCFRYGWGVKVDAVAARSYYETAANLGDADALEEAAWCFLQGFGGAKDKVCFVIFVLLICYCCALACEVYGVADATL